MNWEEMLEFYDALSLIKSVCKKQKLCNLGCPLCVEVDEKKLDCVLKEFVKPEYWNIKEPPVTRWQALEQVKRVKILSIGEIKTTPL